MSPDRVRVMFWGSQRQVVSPPRWAEPNVSRGCYTVIKNDSVSYLQAVLVVTTEETFDHKNSGSFLVFSSTPTRKMNSLVFLSGESQA